MIAFVAGALFAIGLALAGATEPHVVLQAFHFDASWDPRLWLMFAGSLLVAVPSTRWLARRRRTLRGEPLRIVPARPIDRRLVIGSLVFGVGWGLGGTCPGPAFATAASGTVHAAFAFTGLWAGILLHDLAQRRSQARESCAVVAPPSGASRWQTRAAARAR